MKVNLEKLNELVEQKYLTCRKHPTEELYIYNYTAKCQYEPYWTEETMMCRGLIVDKEGIVKARPFKKFFNLEELKEIPNCKYEITDKLDGSLGIMYWIDDAPFIATRGSFDSDQAKKANEMLRNHEMTRTIKFEGQNPLHGIDRKCTYLFEILYPENKIVVDYGQYGRLVLIAKINIETGEEYELPETYLGFHCVEKFNYVTIDKLKEFNRKNAEGFVIRWEEGTRAKVKYDEYVRLHWIMFGMTERGIWESLRNGDDILKTLDKVPDEFYDWVKNTINKFNEDFKAIESAAYKVFDEVKSLENRKDQALKIKDMNGGVGAIVFKMIDGKSYKDLIWKMLKPKKEE